MNSSGAPRSVRPGPNGVGISGRAVAVLVALGALAATLEPAHAAGAPFSEIVAVVHLHTSLADGSSTCLSPMWVT